jgi:hypothetical protein
MKKFKFPACSYHSTVQITASFGSKIGSLSVQTTSSAGRKEWKVMTGITT